LYRYLTNIYLDGYEDVATLENPGDLVFSPDRKLICFSDLGSHTIRVFDLIKKEIRTVFGNKTYGAEDGESTYNTSLTFSGCSFAFPHGLVFSEDGNLVFVADTNNHSIRCLDMQNQMCVTVVGMEHKKGTAGGSLKKALISEPRGVARNSSGHLIVSSSSAIYNIDLDANKATIIAGGEGTGYKDGRLDESLFDHPDGLVCINNLIFVADTYNHRIRVISLEAEDCCVSTYAVTFSRSVGNRRNGTSRWTLF